MCLNFQPFLCDIFFSWWLNNKISTSLFPYYIHCGSCACVPYLVWLKVKKSWDCDVVVKYKKTLLSCLSRSTFLWGFIFCIFVVDRLLMHLAFCRWWLIVTFLRARDSLLVYSFHCRPAKARCRYSWSSRIIVQLDRYTVRNSYVVEGWKRMGPLSTCPLLWAGLRTQTWRPFLGAWRTCSRTWTPSWG